MTNSRCGIAVRLLSVLGLLVLAATSWAQPHHPIIEKLAKTYGSIRWARSRRSATPGTGSHRSVQS